MATILSWCIVSGLATKKNTRNKKSSSPNKRPIIGILSQEMSPHLLPTDSKGASYIAASYVKYIESAGGRVVPILTTMSKLEIENIFRSINGLLYPGGDAPLFKSRYFNNSALLYTLAKKANARGDFFPIWGTCLGFQALSSIVAGKQVVSRSDATDLILPLNLTNYGVHSRMLKDAPQGLINMLAKERLTYNFHHNCVTPDTFVNNKKLKKAFKVVSYNNDVNGKTFISTMEGINQPFYGTQWHPEKNCFEWSLERNIAHSKDAVSVTQYFADFFVNEARKSQHSFDSEEEANKYLIYNYSPVYTGDAGHFEQCYVF
eukprot:Seg584.3 transcript_id=Seg584.3/GoldUCD/mRNA.D3Y31 product="Gamma-glutamyl hydrolase" protein_id=Seg584.3/GoldUCD/D3Y31